MGGAGSTLTKFMEGDGKEEGSQFRVTVVSNRRIKGWWIMLPSFPEVASVGGPREGQPRSRVILESLAWEVSKASVALPRSSPPLRRLCCVWCRLAVRSDSQ